MATLNKVILIGNCGRDPELRYMPSGTPVANVSIATSSRRKDKTSGEMVEDTQWHRVTFYDRLAEIVGEHVKKGKQIYAEGYIKYGHRKDKDGVQIPTVDIIAHELKIMGLKSDNAGTAEPQRDQTVLQQKREQQPALTLPPAKFPEDDIPF